MKFIRRSFPAVASLSIRVIATVIRLVIVFILYEPGEAPYFKGARQRFFRRRGRYFVLDD